MKHFWVFAFVSIIITAFFGGFAFPEKGYATVTGQEITTLIVNNKSNFNSFSPSLADNYEMMVNSVADKLKNDPDINIYQLSRYVLEGIPGSTVPNQQGFIPLVKGEIAFGERNNKPNTVQMATLVLAAAEQILSNTVTNEQKAAGIITAEQAAEQMANASNATGVKTSAVLTKRAEPSCSLISSSPILDCLELGTTWLVKSIILNIVGFFLWMSANLLNFAMYHGVFKFSEFAPKEIYNIWLVVRQIISLFVFFAGLFVGFMAIIGKSEEFKKYVAFLVVFGLFVNFSYPIVRVFVDVSNVVSLQIYQTTLGKDILLTDNPSGDDTAGARIMRSMGLQGLVMSATSLSDKANAPDSSFINTVTSLPGAIAIVAVVGSAAYILFMIAMMIIARTALLVCIIIASPILLVDTIVPALGEKAKWLRGVFISQLFVAPVFAIMLALTLKFLDIFSELNKGPNALTGAGANTAAVFFNLIMMLVMLWIMYKVTKTVAGSVGDTVTNWAGKAGGMGTGMALGAGAATLGFAGRNTVGRLAANLGKKDWGGGVLGNAAKSTFSKIGDASFDGRKFGIVQSVASTAGITNLGKGGQNGYAKNREESEKKTFERAGDIGNDEARAEYLGRRLPTGKLAQWTGRANENQKTYSKFIKGDDSTLREYARSDEEGRERMMLDDKNKKFKERFEKISTGDTDKMSNEIKNALKEKTRKEEEILKAYISATETQRARMSADDKNNILKERFAAVNKYYNPTATEEEKASALSDLSESGRATIQHNNEIIAEKMAERTIKNAQLSASQSMTAQLEKMVRGNDDIAQLLKGIAYNGSINPSPTQVQNNNIIIPTTGGAGRSKQAIPVPIVASTSVPPKEMDTVTDLAQALPV